MPTSLMGFLEPGMCIGVGTVQGSSEFTVYVYSRQDYDIARSVPYAVGRDGRHANAQQVIDTHPAFQKRVDAFLEKLKETSPDADPDGVYVYRSARNWFGTVTAVGNDYVLITREGETKRRCILAKSAISRIDLDAEPIYLGYSPRRDNRNSK